MPERKVVVIGSGPTGAAAAARLADMGLRPTVVNSSSLEPPGWVVRFMGRTVARRAGDEGLDLTEYGNAVSYTSSALGGLSNYWTAAVPRFDDRDFDVHGALDRRWEWPVGGAELAEGYAMAERLMTITAASDPALRGLTAEFAHTRRLPSDWTRVLNDLPLDSQVTSAAIGPPFLAARRPREWDSHRCVFAPLIRAGQVELLTGRARRIVLDGGRPSGVVVEVGGSEETIAADAVLVCAGTLGSLGVLRRSADADHPTGLGDTDGLLGSHMVDHPHGWCYLTFERALRTIDHPVQVRKPASAESPYAWQASIGMSGGRDRIKAWMGSRTKTFGCNFFGTDLPRPESRAVIGDDGQIEALEAAYSPAAVAALENAPAELAAAFSEAGFLAEPSGVIAAVAPPALRCTGREAHECTPTHHSVSPTRSGRFTTRQESLWAMQACSPRFRRRTRP